MAAEQLQQRRLFARVSSTLRSNNAWVIARCANKGARRGQQPSYEDSLNRTERIYCPHITTTISQSEARNRSRSTKLPVMCSDSCMM